MNKQQIDPLSPDLPSNTDHDRAVFFCGTMSMIVAGIVLLNIALNDFLKSTGIVFSVLFLIVFVPYLLCHKGILVNVCRCAALIIVITVAFNVVSK